MHWSIHVHNHHWVGRPNFSIHVNWPKSCRLYGNLWYFQIVLKGRLTMQVHLLLFPLLLLPMASASCFGRDAHFKKKAPVVVQPNRADPTKVWSFMVTMIMMKWWRLWWWRWWWWGTLMIIHITYFYFQILVSWEQAIERPQCVDRWMILLTRPLVHQCIHHHIHHDHWNQHDYHWSWSGTGCEFGQKELKWHSVDDILSMRLTLLKSRLWWQWWW